MNRQTIRPYFLFACFVLLASLGACRSELGEADPDSESYRRAVSDFYLSLAASQTDEALFAFNKMNDVARQYPDEPAAWANLGVYAMRQGNYDLAASRLGTARELAPDHPDILFLSGLLSSRTGDIDSAIDYLRRGFARDSTNLKLSYALVTELERKDDVRHAEEIMGQLEGMHEIAPENLAVLHELMRFSAKTQNIDVLERTTRQLAEHLDEGSWHPDVLEQFEEVRQAVNNGSFDRLSTELAFLRHGLEQAPRFRDDRSRIQLDPTDIGFLITRFLSLPQPVIRAAEPDMSLRFEQESPPEVPADANLLKSVTLLEDLPPKTIYARAGQVHIDENVMLDFPGSANERPLPAHAVAEIDYNYSFRTDLAMAGSEGFRLFRQNDDYTFTDVTPDIHLPNSVLRASYRGLWVADIDLDGDLDLVLAPVGRSPVVLRNNGDDSFTPINHFEEVPEVVDFAWADLDADGAADAVFLDGEGSLHLYENRRSAGFSERDDLPVSSGIKAFAVADVNADGRLNLILLTDDFQIARMDYVAERDNWSLETLVEGVDEEPVAPGTARLFVSDFDNNGRLDFLVSTEAQSWMLLGDDQGRYHTLGNPLTGGVSSVVDLTGDGRLDLLGITAEGEPYQLINHGTQNYFAQTIRARASGVEGDGRINSFGIGGEMEIRSGLLYQKQLITSPNVHFGLGDYREAEMLRIVWPNGSVQAQFAELGMGSTIYNEQILKGSCPWLFSHDGEQMQFVTDILWRSPLGLRINAQETAGIVQTLDRVRIPGDLLKPSDGHYDLRITAELWETHFFDFVELVVVDHPAGTEVFVDERFGFPPPDLRARLVSKPRPVARVLDHRGNDVTETVRRQDGNYLRTFDKTMYQGLVEKHYIEVHLGEQAPEEGPLWLVASGWLRPTDSSINLALSQGTHPAPQGMRIEVFDGVDRWTELHDDYGIPAGKTKSILINLEGVFPDPADRRLRIHTTSEIYWDAIQWAEGLPDGDMKKQPLALEKAELRFRGYSEWSRADEVSPKLPNYNVISGTTPRWRDLIGFHTRFGDVKELLQEIDDRYVIMNAGDELVLHFPQLTGPDPGWQRSYIFVSDGWEKDGDYNTEASKTVLPLPYHGQADYEYAGSSWLLDDPVYRKHREDWVTYHTRYVTPDAFRGALLFQNE